jgi:tRNA(Arg) A34 adenosine deaminase TadA
MCYATAYWAGIRTVFYAASWSDYSDLFSDEAINDDMQKKLISLAEEVSKIISGLIKSISN